MAWYLRTRIARQIERYTMLRSKQLKKKEQLQVLATVDAVTKDGTVLHLAANISSVKELDIALKQRGAGCRIVPNRVFVYGPRNFPGEEEQFEVYRLVARKQQDIGRYSYTGYRWRQASRLF